MLKTMSATVRRRLPIMLAGMVRLALADSRPRGFGGGGMGQRWR